MRYCPSCSALIWVPPNGIALCPPCLEQWNAEHPEVTQ